jgi:hypothetical protein
MKFYILNRFPDKNHLLASVAVIQVEPVNELPEPLCVCCGRVMGPCQYKSPINVVLEFEAGVSKYGDILDFSADALLVSDRFKNRFVSEGLTGLSGFESVNITEIRGRSPLNQIRPSYAHASVLRSRAAIDEKASGVRRMGEDAICRECRLGGTLKRVARIVLEPGSWDGLDLFIARGLPGDIIVTDRFKSFAEHHQFANINLVNTEDYAFDFYPGEN